MPKLSTPDYRALAAFRHQIRKFLTFSEQAAREAGVEPRQHQLLLAVRGLPADARPTIGAVAERLCVQHHTAVALVDKLEARGLVIRERSTNDRREVLLKLTKDALAMLDALSQLHRDQLQNVAPRMVAALATILSGREAAVGAAGAGPLRRPPTSLRHERHRAGRPAQQ